MTVLFLSTVVLLALPFFRVGANNDLEMRAAIVPLMMLAIMCAQVISTKPTIKSTLLTLLLVVGAATPICEMWRAVESTNFMDQRVTLIQMFDEHASWRQQYMAPPTKYLTRPYWLDHVGAENDQSSLR